MVGAVQTVIGSIGQAAADRDVRQIVKQAACTDRGCHGAAGKCNQVCNQSAIERKFQDLLILHDLRDAGASRFHLSGVPLNFDLFRDLTDFQHGVDYGGCVDCQDNSCLDKRPEAGQRGLQMVHVNVDAK